MRKIGNMHLTKLKEMYQTPLYIYDEEKIRAQCRLFKNYFKHEEIETEIIYAGKAFLTKAMAQLIEEEGLSLDCVSQGEIYTALMAKFPPNKIFLHGNNKTQAELEMCLKFKIGTIIIDNPYEAEILMNLVSENDQPQVMLRINPLIEAHTHKYIQTASLDSKFGISIKDPKIIDTIEKLYHHPYIKFLGTHSHIGSQILNEEAFYQHARTVLDFYFEVYQKTGIQLKEMNLGGGFGIKYLENDEQLNLTEVLPKLISEIDVHRKKLNLELKKVYLEPGRSIVGEAGYTLYTVNQIKETMTGKKYLFIDGSMNDHLRTALYGALYEAVLVGKERLPKTTYYTVAGKACESGDIIIEKLALPQAENDDLLLVKSTGAYHYSMASHYNRITIPPVVFVRNGQAKVVVKRESYMDLMARDEDLK